MNTEYKNIDNILNKYFEGYTTLEEEQLLRDYFASDNVAHAHKVYQPLFQYTATATKQRNPNTFTIDKRPKQYKFYYAASVALLIGFSLVWFMQSNHKKRLNFNDTATHIQISNQNPEKKKEAEKEIKKFTKSVNRGFKDAGALSIFGRTTKKIFNIKKEKK